MLFNDYFRLALRNLWRRKLRSFLTISAVVVGSLSVIIMLSLVIGAKSVFVSQVEAIGGFTLVTVVPSMEVLDSNGGGLIQSGGGDVQGENKLDDSVLEQLAQLSHVVEASPLGGVNYLKQMKVEGGEKRRWNNIIAYEPDSKVLDLELRAGRNVRADDMGKVVLGSGAARDLGYESDPESLVGKNLIFITEGSYSGWGVEVPKPPMNADKDWWEERNKQTVEVKGEIVGVLASGMDDGQSYTNMKWARAVMTERRWEYPEGGDWKNGVQPEMELVTTDRMKENGYGSILLKIDRTENVEEVAEKVKALGYGAQTAKQFMDEINQILTMVGAIAGAIGGISLFVAAIGIINTMVMSTYERTREIGVMRACGATRAIISRLFTFEAALLGFLGGALGLGLSYILSIVGNYFGVQFAAEQGLSIDTLITFPWWLIAGVLAFTSLIGLLSGLYPAHRAAKLNPVEALRYE